MRFLSRGNGYSLFLTSDEAVLALRKSGTGNQKSAGKSKLAARQPNLEPSLGKGGSTAPAILRMHLVGGNPASPMKGVEELPGKSNYFIGNQPSQWHTNVANYRKVAVSNVYPGIDLVYYGSRRQLEYDFVVSAGANAEAIRLALRGTKSLHIDSQGCLVMKVAGGEVRLQKPIAYQEVGAVQHTVDARYVLKGTRQVAFQVGKYDRSRPLIIDPILAYSTYLGGSSIDGANGIAVAPDGTAFVAGGTFSSNFPTVHALQPNAGGPFDFPQDAFVAKISADGSTLLYSTYLGGENQDVANGIAVDDFGNAYVVGTTLSPHFPVTPGSINTLCGGDGECGASFNPQGFIVSNAFVSKLNPAGSALIYSTFLGYYENVVGLAVAVDGDGNAYVAGQTGPNLVVTTLVPPPPNFPIVGGFQAGFGGATDAYVIKVSASGANILYSTYVGGSSEEIGYGIAALSGGTAYVTGLTYSADFPTASPFQAAYAGAGDAFVTKIDTTAVGTASLLYSTYLGGSGLDQGNGLAVDSGGNAYLTGPTCSTDFPLTNPLQPTAGGDCDAFVTKLNPTGAALVYSTYLGGSLADAGTGIAVDTSGNAYVTGSTVSTDFPIVGAVFQPKYAGGNADAFVTELDSTGSALVYSSYLGGSNTDSGTGIAVDTGNPASAFVSGQTCSLDFPLANPLQSSSGGNCDAFITKVSVLEGIALNPTGLSFAGFGIGVTSAPQTVTLTNGDNPQTISSIAVTGIDAGDFAQTNTCPASLAPGVQCSITVTFTPTAGGVRKAAVTITDSAPGSPHVVSLTGGISAVQLSASSLDFGNQTVGVTSNPQTVTVTNTSTTLLTVSGVAASGDFAKNLTNTCTIAPLEPTTNCVISVSYTPSIPGSSVGALIITDSAAGSPQVILLTGTGFSEPLVNLSTSNLGFASQTVGTTSAAQPVTLQNTGSAPLNISGIVVAPSTDFGQTNTCGPSLSAGATCTISVSFTPSAAGSRTASLTITDNAPNSPQVVSLTGTGVAAPIVTLSATSLTFADQSQGTTSPAKVVTVSNSGTAPLTITSIAATGDFAETNNCGASVANGGICQVNITFTPTAPGSRYGSVAITDNATGSPQTISLAGNGLPAPIVNLSASTLTFANQPIGTTSTPQSVTLSNTGTAALTITRIVATGDFVQTNTCGASVAAGANCTIGVTFTPSAAGSRTGSLTITDNAASNPQVISLGGNGADFAISVAPSSATVIAGNSVSYTFTVTPSFGFNAKVALNCSGAPSRSTCLVSPTSVTPDGINPVTAAVTVTTAQRSQVPPGRAPNHNLPRPGPTWWLWLVILTILTSIATLRHRRACAGLTIALGLVLFWVACGAGGSQVDVPSGTPAGNYTLTLSGASGTVSHTTTVIVTVK